MRLLPSSSSDRPSVRFRWGTPSAWLVGLGLGALLIVGTVSALNAPLAKATDQAQGLVNLQVPDAQVDSENLATLPRDMLKVPLLKALLTEDFLTFYDTDEDWLSFKGALKRISFEHELKWSDQWLLQIAQTPAHIDLWRDGKGGLRYWAISLDRPWVTRMAQDLLSLKWAQETQLSQLMELNVAGEKVQVVKLVLSPRRSLVWAAKGQRLVLFSHDQMLARQNGTLSANAQEAIIQRLTSPVGRLSQDNVPLDHQITLGSALLTWGYQDFIPQVRGLRLGYDRQQWRTQVHLTHTPPTQAWRAVPAEASACGSFQLDTQRANQVAEKGQLQGAFQPLNAWLDQHAIVCWYNEFDANEPLWMVRLKPHSNADHQQLIKQAQTVFDWAVAKTGAATTGTPTPTTATTPSAATVKVSPLGASVRLTRSPRIHPQSDPALLITPDTLYFSTQSRLLDKALAVSEQRYPHLESAAAPNGRSSLLYFHPTLAAQWMTREGHRMLSQKNEPVLRAAFDFHMPARLNAMAALPPMLLTVAQQSQANGWQEAQWQAAP